MLKQTPNFAITIESISSRQESAQLGRLSFST